MKKRKRRKDSYSHALPYQTKNFLYEVSVSNPKGGKVQTRKVLYGSETELTAPEVHALARQNLLAFYNISNATIRITAKYQLSKTRKWKGARI